MNEYTELKKAIAEVDGGPASSSFHKVLDAAKERLAEMKLDPLAWMDKDQRVYLWDYGYENTPTVGTVRRFNEDGSVVSVRGVFWNQYCLPEAIKISHNGNGQNPLEGDDSRRVMRKYPITKYAQEAPLWPNTCNWDKPCEFIIFPEGF